MADSSQPNRKPKVRFRRFESHTKPWVKMCEEATAFASEIPTGDLISISHSQEGTKGVIAVWYWAS